MSFWGELSDYRPKMASPRSILQAAANEIADKTNQRILGEIDSTLELEGQRWLQFFLSVPSANARVEMVQISYKPTAFYPVALEDSFDIYGPTDCQNPEQLQAALTGLFADSQIRTVVADLLELAAEEDGEEPF